MNVKLPNNQEAFIQSLVANGRFESKADAMTEAIRLLEERERLRTEVNQGVEQLNANKVLEEDEVFPDILAELNEIERQRSNSS
ncbi:type II toxin-antitoxin system ParD family antitoxin [Bremerella sp. JC770]|uniref:ribbon-helix-helix domain-containing protein n=1 Tax=Bremerella sp. JC770 TaxID=3232137 RepID=UPI0034577E39